MSYLCLQYCRVIEGKTSENKALWSVFVIAYWQLFYFKNSENFGTGSYLLYWGRDSGGIVSLWVIFEVLIAVCVKRAVVLFVTPCRLIEIYHPFFFYFEMRSGRFLHFNGGNRTSCFLQNICKFLPDFISWEMKFLKNKELCKRFYVSLNPHSYFITCWRWNRYRVPKRRLLTTTRRRGNTQKNCYHV